LEKFIDPVRDADEFAEAFAVGVGHVRRIRSESGGTATDDDRPSLWRRIFRS
jgi:hypothetical protein